MADYIKCPRCDLNYIRREQEYCDVCKAEMKGKKLLFANDEEDEGDAEATELCPICKQNYIRPDEEICKACREEAEAAREDDLDMDKDEEWRTYLEDEKEDPIGDVSFAGLETEEDDSLDSDSYTGEKTDTSASSEPDDFEILPIDEKDFQDDDEDDEEEEEDEDDDL